MNNKTIIIVGHIGPTTDEHVAHVLSLHGLHACGVEIITPDDAKERGILEEAGRSRGIELDKLILKTSPEVFELRAMPKLETPTYITPSHRRVFVPRSNKRNNLKKKRR